MSRRVERDILRRIVGKDDPVECQVRQRLKVAGAVGLFEIETLTAVADSVCDGVQRQPWCVDLRRQTCPHPPHPAWSPNGIRLEAPAVGSTAGQNPHRMKYPTVTKGGPNLEG